MVVVGRAAVAVGAMTTGAMAVVVVATGAMTTKVVAVVKATVATTARGVVAARGVARLTVAPHLLPEGRGKP